MICYSEFFLDTMRFLITFIESGDAKLRNNTNLKARAFIFTAVRFAKLG